MLRDDGALRQNQVLGERFTFSPDLLAELREGTVCRCSETLP